MQTLPIKPPSRSSSKDHAMRHSHEHVSPGSGSHHSASPHPDPIGRSSNIGPTTSSQSLGSPANLIVDVMRALEAQHNNPESPKSNILSVIQEEFHMLQGRQLSSANIVETGVKIGAVLLCACGGALLKSFNFPDGVPLTVVCASTGLALMLYLQSVRHSHQLSEHLNETKECAKKIFKMLKKVMDSQQKVLDKLQKEVPEKQMTERPPWQEQMATVSEQQGVTQSQTARRL